jgi:hypothetical protein
MITKSMRKHNNKVVRGSEAGAASSWSELADQDLAGEQLNMRRETNTERVRVTSVSWGGGDAADDEEHWQGTAAL